MTTSSLRHRELLLVHNERRKAGRPRVEVYKPRKQRGLTRRALPRFVDMGALTTERVVRYDPEQQHYDVRDVLELAYDSADGASRVLHELRKEGFFDTERTQMWLEDHRLAQADFSRLKWADAPSNRGRARELASAAGCLEMLRCTYGPRAPSNVGTLVAWFQDSTPAATCFLEATQAHPTQVANEHQPAELALPVQPGALRKPDAAEGDAEPVPDSEEQMSEVDGEGEEGLPDEAPVEGM